MTHAFRLSGLAVLALLLSLLPITAVINQFMPLWGVMLMLYIQYTFKNQYVVGHVVVFGLLMDALYGTLMGMHSFALILTLWVSSQFAMRFRLMAVLQQMMLIVLFLMIYQLTMTCFHWILGDAIDWMLLVLPIMTSAVCWPWLQYLVDGFLFTAVR